MSLSLSQGIVRVLIHQQMNHEQTNDLSLSKRCAFYFNCGLIITCKKRLILSSYNFSGYCFFCF